MWQCGTWILPLTMSRGSKCGGGSGAPASHRSPQHLSPRLAGGSSLPVSWCNTTSPPILFSDTDGHPHHPSHPANYTSSLPWDSPYSWRSTLACCQSLGETHRKSKHRSGMYAREDQRPPTSNNLDLPGVVPWAPTFVQVLAANWLITTWLSPAIGRDDL